MELSTLDLVVIAVYFIGLALFGVLVRRIRSFSDYSVARRSVPMTMIMASLCATYIGPGYTMGLAGKAFASGYFFLIFFLFFSIQTILVGLFLAPRLTGFREAHTLGDVMRVSYGVESQLLTGMISLGLLTGFAAVMARAGGSILAGVLDVPLWLGITIITGVGVIYTFTGGLKAVIATEAIQFAIMIAGISAMTLFARVHLADTQTVQSASLELTGDAFAGQTGGALLGLALAFLLGETLIPPYANRALASGSAAISQKGFVLAGVFSVFWFGMVATLGQTGRQLLPADTPEDSVFMELAAAVLPHGFLGLVVIALAAVVMSSQESVLNAGAVAFTRDLVGVFRPLNDRTSLLISRFLTAVLGAASIYFALQAASIIEGLMICYSIWACTVLPPLIWSLLGLPTSRTAGFLALLLGTVASVSILIFKLGGGSSTTALLAGLTASAVGGLLGAIVRPRGSASC